jgi:hypothetical protein
MTRFFVFVSCPIFGAHFLLPTNYKKELTWQIVKNKLAYSASELKEFEELILKKLEKAKS